MTENDIATGHLPPARADAARHAAGVLLEAARGWAAATKRDVGAGALPDDPAGARAFDAFFAARRELARHLGGPDAWRVGAHALTMASSASTPGASRAASPRSTRDSPAPEFGPT